LNNPDSRYPTATRWKPHTCFLRTDIPADLFGWLLDPASLTLRLQQLCHGEFRVRVLSQEWGTPRIDEARALGVVNGRRAIIRQVQLLCNQCPWIFARTVIPASSLQGSLQRLARLGSRPLGAVLFADPGMRRGIVELACIQPGQALFAEAARQMKPPAEIWGRRSVFTVSGKSLLVSEIFLPAFPAGKAHCPARKPG